MDPEAKWSDKDVDLLRKHLEAQLTVEAFTLPVYLTAVYSFTKKAQSDPAGFDLQQRALSVAVQEMYHLQGACNLANAFQVRPSFEYFRKHPLIAGKKIVVPHLDPDLKPLVGGLGNLPQAIVTLEAVEKPAPANKPRPKPHLPVEYPSIGDLYWATLQLMKKHYDTSLPPEKEPLSPDRFQVAFGAFATRYIYNKVGAPPYLSHGKYITPLGKAKEDTKQVANAIADQGEGSTILKELTPHYKHGVDDEIHKQYQPAVGSRFYKYDKLTHYKRFEDIQQILAPGTKDGSEEDFLHAWATTWKIVWQNRLGGNPIFYEANGQQSPDLPDWAQKKAQANKDFPQKIQQDLNVVWSYILDLMEQSFADGSLDNTSSINNGPGFGEAMLAFKYIIPLIWQFGCCPSFVYKENVSGNDVRAAMDGVDPFCLYHWDERTIRVRQSGSLNGCQGLNTCKSLGWGGIATKPGDGACATADFHTCQGSNSCAGQGGCGFLSSVAEGSQKESLPCDQQWIPDLNSCKSKGGCQTPIASGQKFSSPADIGSLNCSDGGETKRLNGLKGQSVWDEARRIFAKKEGIKKLPAPLAEKKNTIDYDGTTRRGYTTPTST